MRETNLPGFKNLEGLLRERMCCTRLEAVSDIDKRWFLDRMNKINRMKAAASPPEIL